MVKKTKTGDIKTGYVKKETMLIVALITLVVGFVGGVTYSSFKFETGTPVQTSVTQQQTLQDQAESAKQAEMAQSLQEIESLEKETSQNPENVEAWIQLGNLYFDSNRFEKAIRAYKRSLELDHNNPDVWTDMGVMYRRSGQTNEAIKAFETAMEIDPNHEISRFNKGVVLMHDLNDREGAIMAWEGLIKVNPFASTPNGQPITELVQTLKASMKQ
jgi:cytochrome c-type biogenesis protein CcmH/NrfG